MKLDSHTQSGHGLALGGRHFKNNKTSLKKKKKTKVKKIHLPLIYIIQSAILNHTPFHFQKEKNYKNSEHKGYSGYS